MKHAEGPNGDSRLAPEAAGPRINVWHVILRYQWTMVAATVVGGGLGYLYYLKQTPVYASSAQVLVTNSKRKSLPVEGIDATLGYEDNLGTHSLLIRSPLLVDKAIKEHHLDSLASLAGASNPAQVIIRGISVGRADAGGGGDGSADVLELRYAGTDPQDCAEVLNAIIETHQTFLGETAQSISKETLDLIAEAKDSLLTQLRNEEDEYRRFRQESPLLWREGAGRNIHQARLSDIEEARSELLLAHTQTKAQLQSIERALMTGGNREALMLMVERGAHGSATGGRDTQSLTSQLFPLLIDEQMLLETHGAEHPKVTAIQSRINATRRYFQTTALDNDGRNGATKPVDFLLVYVHSLQEELTATEERLRELDALFEKEREAAKAMEDSEIADEAFRKEILRTQQLFEGVVKRLEEVNLVRDYGGYKAQVISPAGHGVQIGPNLAKIMAFSCVIGLAVGLALSCTQELADKSFRSPQELMAQLGMPIFGHIPYMPPPGSDPPSGKVAGDAAPSKLQPILQAFHKPNSRLSEAYRAVRTALYFGLSEKQHKVIQVSSPNKGDGKTSLAGNLAISIAQSGKRVLLIDADLRRPRVHKLFGLDRDLGLSSVIEGEADWRSVVKDAGVENMWCITCGKIPDNPAELLTSHKFEELLDELKQQYDFLVIDTPPLLAVTDPCVVAARADGVLLVVRNTKRAAQDATRATDMLDSLGATTLGVIVVGTEDHQSHGYGTYGYGGSRHGKGRYGYGYGYEYGHQYGENGNEEYLTDEAHTQGNRPAPHVKSLASLGRREGRSRDSQASRQS